MNWDLSTHIQRGFQEGARLLTGIYKRSYRVGFSFDEFRLMCKIQIILYNQETRKKKKDLLGKGRSDRREEPVAQLKVSTTSTRWLQVGVKFTFKRKKNNRN